MVGSAPAPRIPLPNGWSRRVRSAVIHAISLAHFSLTSTRSQAANSWNARIRLKAENDRLRQELALLQEETARSLLAFRLALSPEDDGLAVRLAQRHRLAFGVGAVFALSLTSATSRTASIFRSFHYGKQRNSN